MTFLVTLIPGPIRRTLIDDLLAKLRSVDALDEAEYGRALDEPIVVLRREPPRASTLPLHARASSVVRRTR